MDLLPEHILVDIFRSLDKNSLKKASKVCLRWYEVITSSSVILKNRCTTFNMNTLEQLIDSIEDLDHIPYKSIHFHTQLYQNQDLLRRSINVIKEHASHIEKVSFVKPSLNTFTKIIDALDCDRITYMSIWPGSEDQLNDNMAINLPNLKCLNVCNGSRILRMIKSHKISVLDMKIKNGYFPSAKDINRFLQTCPDLKFLSFMDFFPVIETKNMKFQLKYLSIMDSIFNEQSLTRQQEDCLKNLIEMSCDTLEFFVLQPYAQISEIIKFMLPKVTNLKRMMFISVNSNEIEDDFPVHHGLTELIGSFDHNPQKNVKMMKKMINACPGLESLDLRFFFDDDVTQLIHEAALKLPNLKTLSIWNPSGTFSSHFPLFKNLETLRIRNISCQKEIKSLMDLMLSVPKLKILKIDNWDGDRLPYLTKVNLKKILTACKELKEIFIRGKFILPKQFVDGLLEARSSIQKLVIETSDVNLVRENGRKLLKSKIRCTALQLQSMESLDDCSDYEESSDDEDMDMNESSDLFYSSEDEDMMDMSVDQYIDIDMDLEEEHRIEAEDVVMAENPMNDNDRELILDQNEINIEIDDRFDEMGRRRSKRLRRN